MANYTTRFCTLLAVVLTLAACGGDKPSGPPPEGRTIVLGFDGMDPNIVSGWMEDGMLPNFSKLAAEGHFSPLATTIPAQSPVAWSGFATGTDPGQHGVYDFLRRDPETYLPSFSVSETIFPETAIELGDWHIPLADAEILNRRQGKPFWNEVEDRGGSSTVLRVPVTYPPDDIDYMIAGMGVPDLLGTQGTYTLYTTRPLGVGQNARIVYMKADAEGKIDTVLEGPPHPLKKELTPLTTPLTFYPVDGGGTGVVLGDSEFVLQKGEWSDWVTVSYNILNLINVPGTVRLFLLEDYPRPKVYISPIQIDPNNPVAPISSPSHYAQELAARIGDFHTIGMPEETWSLNNDHLTDAGFLEMVSTTYKEREAMLFDALENNNSSLIVGVFVQTDRVSHMFYRGFDPEHALYEETDERGRDAIAWTYREADRILGKVMDQLGEKDRLIVMSDHGFSPYRWSVHLNRWLVDNGYMVLDEGAKESGIGFENVDWSKTRAYAVGLNSLYINKKGRESEGIVTADEVDALKAELFFKLQEMHDEKLDQPIVKTMYDGAVIYQGNANNDAPDLVVGYYGGYRASWQTTLGAVPKRLVEVNRSKWSGDHCVAVDQVPGVLFTSFKPKKDSYAIDELAEMILEE